MYKQDDAHQAVENTQGVRPAIQARSLKKRNELLAVGLRLMRDRPLDEISIKEICTHAHCTVGSFYSRFEDKESYFDAMLAQGCEMAIAQAESLFDNQSWGQQSGVQVADGIVQFVAQLFKEDFSPVMTESFLRECKGQTFSTPIDEVGKRFGRVIYDVLAPHVDQAIHSKPLEAIGFALQVLYSTLINASLRRTIVPIGSEAFDRQLKTMFQNYLGIR